MSPGAYSNITFHYNINNKRIFWLQFFATVLPCLMLLLSANLNSQEIDRSNLDSLFQITADIYIEDTVKTIAFSKLAKSYIDIDIDTARYFANKGLELSKKIDFQSGMALNYLRIGLIEEVESNLDQAIMSYQKASEQYENITKDKFYLEAIISLGIVYENQQNYDQSLHYYLQGLATAEFLEDSMGMAYFYNNVSIIYELTGNFRMSIDYNRKASAIFKLLDHDLYYANSLVNLGILYSTLGKIDTARLLFLQAEELQLDMDNYYGLMNLYMGIGGLDIEMKDYNSALNYYLNAKKYANLLDYSEPEKRYSCAIINKGLGDIYFYLNNPNRAIPYFQFALEEGVELKSLHLQREAFSGLYKCYGALHIADSAFHFMKKYLIVHDSLEAEIHNKRIDELDYQYQLEREKQLMAKEKELIIADQKNQKLFFLIIIGSLFTALLIFVFFWYYQKNKLRQSKLERKNLELERSQLQFDLDYKNKELTTNVLHLIERNEFISQLSEKLQNIDDNTETDTILDVVKEIDRNTSGNLWQEFEKTYMDVHKDFHIALTTRYPKLTANDRKICAFILMNMSTKDISSITYQSPQSIKIARYRLRKKLGLTRSENLSAFLNQMESSAKMPD
ncbi:MAG: hypothetical protein DRI83_12030 [Bacteroidetes bacterium]|nr:MAG: hypothetical protein DRI83_12030 [Bacteroidota bacterium]